MRHSARIDVTSMNGVMDEHEMTSGVIPLRHASLPGHVKLPRRYEKAAMGSNGIPVRVRKISIQPGQSVLGDSLSDRLDDLMAAILWVKQELIMLRQHDILLKRQFFDIQHSIQTLQKPRSPRPSSSPPTTTTTPSPLALPSTPPCPHPLPCPAILLNGNPLTEEEEEEEEEEETGTTRTTTRATKTTLTSNTDINSNLLKVVTVVTEKQDFPLGAYVVRPASSETMLKTDSEEEEEDGEEKDLLYRQFFRLRSSSMRTSRDMAALARRRGSKELI